MRTKAAELDHLVVTAPTLAIGAEFIALAIGAQPDPGGEHPLMGTHNLLLRLGNSSYLEVIAINPAAPSPKRPRWFALDQLTDGSAPKLATWVARTPQLDAANSRVSALLGNVETMTRGPLRWQMTIPADGALAYGGLIPSLIAWQSATHPASNLRESGCSLVGLEAFHPQPALIRELLAQLGLHDALTVSALQPDETPYLLAHIDTPAGMRSLGGPQSRGARYA